MDWYTWMSKTNLDSSLIYEYSLLFSRNELEHEDISHFNHEFLQSMGISIAKHRLEILKLSKTEKPISINSPSESSHRLLIPINYIIRCIRSLVNREYSSAIVVIPRPPAKKVEMLKRSKKTTVTRRVTQERSPQMIMAVGSGMSRRGMIPLVFEDGFRSEFGGTESITWDSMFQGLKPT